MRLLIFALLLTITSAHAQSLQETPKSQQTGTSISDQRSIDSVSIPATAKDEAAKFLISQGWDQLKKGNPTTAIRHFNKASSINPVSAEVYRGLGAATSMRGKHDASVVLLEIASSLDPQNARLAVDTGLEYIRYAISTNPAEKTERTERFESAEKWLKKASSIDPAMNLVDANQALAHAQSGEYAKALPYFARAEAISKPVISTNLQPLISKKQASAPIAAAAPANSTPASSVQPAPAAQATPTAAQPAEAANAIVPTTAPSSQAAIPSVETTASAASSAGPTIVQTSAVVSQPAVQEAALPPTKAEPASGEKGDTEHLSKKKLRVVSGGASAYKGKDMRYCLNQSTNEAIMRCVYPKK